MNRTWRLLAAPLFLALACRTTSNVVQSGNDAGNNDGNAEIVARDLAILRKATRPFQNLDSAVAAGYPRTVADCLVHEHHGAMGYHHSNRALADAKVETDRPEILLYERLPNGDYRLNGVEYIVPYRAWSRDSAPPIAFGQKMRREDNLQLWYLHVWAWTENRDGLFANFNPAVRCPDSTKKVFRPSPPESAPHQPANRPTSQPANRPTGQSLASRDGLQRFPARHGLLDFDIHRREALPRGDDSRAVAQERSVGQRGV